MTSPFTPAMRSIIAAYRMPDRQARQRLAEAIGVLRAALTPMTLTGLHARSSGPELLWAPAANANRARRTRS